MKTFMTHWGDAYHDAVVISSGEEQLYRLWKERLEYILHEFSGFGWGMEYFITGEYYSLPWIDEDEKMAIMEKTRK